MTKPLNSNIGKKFPEITADSLANVRESIPNSAKGTVTLVTIAFMRESQAQIDAWLGPFMERFGNREGFTYYEVAMINVGYLFMRYMIHGAMRKRIPAAKHKHVVTLFGDIEQYINALNLDPRYGYAFLLDREGIICWQGQGFPHPETLKELFDTVEKLA